MDRLWVRLSLAISGVIGLIIVVPLLVLLNSDGLGIGPFDDNPEPLWWEIPETLIQIALVVSLLGIAGGVIVSRALSKPISKLADAAQRVGEGDLETRLDLGGSREISQLSATFNKMAADLQQAEKLRSNLMADVAHELRTPLTALEGNLRAAIDHVYPLDEAELANLYSQTRHLIDLVNDLRELALAEADQLPLQMETIDVEALLTEAVDLFQPLAEDETVQVIMEIKGLLPSITVDEMRIRQVFHNLMTNAIRYTPSGGSVTVRVQADDDHLYIDVIDTGDGIDGEQLPHIFERFYRVDKSRSRDSGGTGLGLAIAKAIIEGHGGRIDVSSDGLGHGSRFTIILEAK